MPQVQDLSSGDTNDVMQAGVVHCILLGFGVFLLCLVGVLSRSQLDLASLWPANGFMLGMLLRFSHLQRIESWLACILGYLMADMLTGQELKLNILLNTINILAVFAAYRLLVNRPDEDKLLRRPNSMLYFIRAVAAASAVSGLGGIMANQWLFGTEPMEGFLRWASSEMVNLTAIVPLILSIPDKRDDREKFEPFVGYSGDYSGRSPAFLPPLAVLLSCIAAVLADGPGSLAFPVPALLWCALRFNLFTTALLSFAYTIWILLAVRAGVLSIGVVLTMRVDLISTRFGVALIALAPIVVASIMTAQRQLLRQLRHQADFDFLTGLHNRRSFLSLGEAAVSNAVSNDQPVAVMMIDVDHFKTINDSFGHSVGDEVLKQLAATLAAHVRPGDTVARVGGEEFAIVLPDCTFVEALSIAERLNGVVRTTPIVLPNAVEIKVTISIGLHFDYTEETLERLLSHADRALYSAKESGRDCFKISSSDDAVALAR